MLSGVIYYYDNNSCKCQYTKGRKTRAILDKATMRYARWDFRDREHDSEPVGQCLSMRCDANWDEWVLATIALHAKA